MAWAQYNLSDGFINATVSENSPATQQALALSGRSAIACDPGLDVNRWEVDITQDPHVLREKPEEDGE